MYLLPFRSLFVSRDVRAVPPLVDRKVVAHRSFELTLVTAYLSFASSHAKTVFWYEQSSVVSNGTVVSHGKRVVESLERSNVAYALPVDSSIGSSLNFVERSRVGSALAARFPETLLHDYFENSTERSLPCVCRANDRVASGLDWGRTLTAETYQDSLLQTNRSFLPGVVSGFATKKLRVPMSRP